MPGDVKELWDAIFGRMDALDGRMDKLDGLMDRLDGRMDRLEAELSQTRTEVVARLDASLTQATADMFQRLDEVAASLKKCIRESQTEVLRALVSAQEGNRLRFVDLERSDSSIKERMAVIEGRLLEIEKKLGGVT